MTYRSLTGVTLSLLLILLLPVQSFALDESTPPTDSTAASDAAAGGKAVEAEPAPPGFVQFLPIMIIGIMFYFILLRPQQKEQQRRKETLQALKKHDKVVTSGGMVGTISDLSSDGRFVTLKVDDNTRIRFLRSSVHGVLEDKTEP